MDRVLYSGVNKNVLAVEERHFVHNDNNQVTKRCVKRSRRINFSGCRVFSRCIRLQSSLKPWYPSVAVATCVLSLFYLCATFHFFFLFSVRPSSSSCYSILCNYGVGKSSHLNQYCISRFFFIISIKYVF